MNENVKLSKGVGYLAKGYTDYALSVIKDRAIQDFRDGLKPVQRRIIQTMAKKCGKDNKLVKCGTLAGDALELHPHGDASVYASMVLMTDDYGASSLSLIHGSGNFGGVYKTDPPAASRYTEAKLNPIAFEFLKDVNGIKTIPNYDATTTEYDVLPVSFPYVLVAPASGIAVGFATNMPSFNFIDVCNLTKEYIKDGKCNTVIYPDFTMGGLYIKDDAEAMKLMTTGKAKIKLRGKYTVSGKDIEVYEFPYGKTIQGLIKQINDKDLPTVRNAYDTDDFNGAGFTIECTNKDKVEETVYLVSKYTDFQYTMSANLTVLKDEVPVTMGVWDIIKEWVSWRRDVVKKEYAVRLSSAQASVRESNAIMEIVKDRAKCEALTALITKEGKQAGQTFVVKNFTREQVPSDLIPVVCDKALSTYHTGGKYAGIAQAGAKNIAEIKAILDNPDTLITKQLDELVATYGKQCARRTEVSDKDFNFEELSDSELKAQAKAKEVSIDTSTCYYSLRADGFLTKARYNTNKDAFISFEGKANDVLIALDNRGRLLRIYCEDIPYSDQIGTFLPKYFDLAETSDYKIVWIGRLEGQELMVIYKDGTVGFVNTKEFQGNTRKTRVIEKGIASGNIGAVLEEVPSVLQILDSKGWYAWVPTDELKRKGRRATTRAFNLKKNRTVASYSYTDLMSMIIYDNSEVYKCVPHTLTDALAEAIDTDSFTEVQ